jgi:hypothetical protein
VLRIFAYRYLPTMLVRLRGTINLARRPAAFARGLSTDSHDDFKTKSKINPSSDSESLAEIVQQVYSAWCLHLPPENLTIKPKRHPFHTGSKSETIKYSFI